MLRTVPPDRSRSVGSGPALAVLPLVSSPATSPSSGLSPNARADSAAISATAPSRRDSDMRFRRFRCTGGAGGCGGAARPGSSAPKGPRPPFRRTRDCPARWTWPEDTLGTSPVDALAQEGPTAGEQSGGCCGPARERPRGPLCLPRGSHLFDAVELARSDSQAARGGPSARRTCRLASCEERSPGRPPGAYSCTNAPREDTSGHPFSQDELGVR